MLVRVRHCNLPNPVVEIRDVLVYVLVIQTVQNSSLLR